MIKVWQFKWLFKMYHLWSRGVLHLNIYNLIVHIDFKPLKKITLASFPLAVLLWLCHNLFSGMKLQKHVENYNL